jgi:hypothetical protein
VPSARFKRALPDDEHRLFSLGRCVFDEFLDAVRTGAKVGHRIGQISIFADHADRQIALRPALADPGVQNRCLNARVGADQQDGVCLFNALNGGVEEIARAAIRRMQR